MYYWYVCLIHFCCAVLLFYIVNWIGKRATPLGYMQISVVMQDETAPFFNYLFKVLAPVVYIVLLAALFQALGWDILCTNIYLIVVYYWVFRLLYVIILGHSRLLNWGLQVIYWISSIGLAVWFNSIVESVSSILPSAQTLVDELWLLIILFVYSIVNKLEISRDATMARKERYLHKSFCSLRSKYGSIVNENCEKDFLKALLYSIMIYENFNRSRFARAVERTVFRHSSKLHSYGVMQVQSSKILTDEESIILSINKIMEDSKSLFTDEYKDNDTLCDFTVVRHIAKLYNGGDVDYVKEVDEIYNFLCLHYYGNMGDVGRQDLR